jgi:DNA-binding NarL/FixJ family response regulator
MIVGCLAYGFVSPPPADGKAGRDRAMLIGLLLAGYAVRLVFSVATFDGDGMAALAQIFVIAAPFFWFRKRHQPGGRQAPDGAAADLVEIAAARYGISNREKEVLALLLEGKSNKEIERALFIAPSTIKNHISALYAKLGINSRGQLMSLILRMRRDV